MDVYTTASIDDVQVMMESKLTELGRETPNVQIVMEPTSRMSLQNESSEFLVVKPELVVELHTEENNDESLSKEQDKEEKEDIDSL